MILTSLCLGQLELRRKSCSSKHKSIQGPVGHRSKHTPHTTFRNIGYFCYGTCWGGVWHIATATREQDLNGKAYPFQIAIDTGKRNCSQDSEKSVPLAWTSTPISWSRREYSRFWAPQRILADFAGLSNQSSMPSGQDSG